MKSRLVYLFIFYCFSLQAVDADFLRNWNERALATAEAYGRSIIQKDQQVSFIDPNVPLNDLYSEKEELGKGSRSVVWLRSDKDNRLFAVKQIEMADDMMDRLHWIQHEFGIGLTLSHPGIVKVYNAVLKANPEDENKAYAYLFMEYIPGLRLCRYMAETKEERRLLLQQYFEGVVHALDRKIVPYGIHGGNVMIDPNPRKLTLVDLELYQWMEATGISCLDFYDEICYVINILLDEENEELVLRKQAWRDLFREDQAFSTPLTPQHAALLRECIAYLQEAV